MVIGRGSIATAFGSYERDKNIIIFASGVSDSTCTNINAFEREYKLLAKALSKSKRLVYFSTTALYGSGSAYIEHKRECEQLITSTSRSYVLFRLPQVVSDDGNPTNLFNTLKRKLLDGEAIQAWSNVYRSLLDIDDLVTIGKYCIDQTDGQSRITIKGPEPRLVPDIVRELAAELDVEPRLVLVKGQASPVYSDSLCVQQAMKYLGIKPQGYTRKVVKKYADAV